MPKFAVINTSNIVVNEIIADTLEIAQEATGETCVQLPKGDFLVWIGDSYNGTSFEPDRNTPERYKPYKPEAVK
jgi:hypothetical protein